jgi:hypothetical protein
MPPADENVSPRIRFLDFSMNFAANHPCRPAVATNSASHTLVSLDRNRLDSAIEVHRKIKEANPGADVFVCRRHRSM